MTTAPAVPEPAVLAPSTRAGPTARLPGGDHGTLHTVPVGAPGTVVELDGLQAGGLLARRAEWSVDGARVLLSGAAPFVDLTGEAGVRADGSFDGTVAMRAAVRLLGLDVAEAVWTVGDWTGGPLAAPAVTLRGTTLAIDLSPVGAEVNARPGPGLPVTRDGPVLTVGLPDGTLPEGTPIDPRVAELFRGLRAWDVTQVRVHRDAPVDAAPAFVTHEDLFFAPGRFGADSPEAVALLDAALRAALAGIVGPVEATPPAPPAQPGPDTSVPPADTGVVPATVPAPPSAPAAETRAATQTSGAATEPGTDGGPDGGAAGGDGPVPDGAAGHTATAAEGAADVEGGTAAAPAVPVELVMPAAPTAPGPAAAARAASVRAAAGGAASAARDLPSPDATTDAARGAVTEPASESAARAREELVAELGARPAPSPEIVALCERIRTAIREHRPVDEDELLSTDPTREAQAAGATVTGSVDSQVQTVGSTYDGLATPPAGTPALTPQPITPPPATTPGLGVDAAGATPDPIPAENLSLGGDIAATDDRIARSGIDNRVTQAIPTAPFSTVRDERGDLGELAQTTPEQLATQQAEAVARSQTDMAAVQAQAMQALRSARSGTVTAVGDGQSTMVADEQGTRDSVGRHAQQLFDTARTQVDTLLQPLARTAIQRWEAGLAVVSQEFHDALDRVQRWIDDRHSGADGWLVGIGDAIFGLPDWVTEEYDRAERAFGDGVCDLLLEISTDVNAVIATAQAIIQQARDDIAVELTTMEAEFPDWVAQERARFSGQLDGLSARVTATSSRFVEDISHRATEAVSEVQAAVEERREAARGVIGRIAAAIEAFIDDPVTAIINGLLTLVGIPPGAFWALVARIQQVVADIANDPESFVNNLVAGVKQGFQQFFDHFGTHVLHGFWDWLFSGLQTPIPMPTDFSAGSLFSFALQLMGITWARVREILVRHVGAENVEIIEAAWQFVAALIERGPAGLVDMIKERLAPEVLVQAVLEAAVEYLVQTLIEQVVVRVVGMLNPVGAVAQAIDLIYRVCSWIFRNAARIFRFVEAVVNGMADVIAGNVTGLATKVEQALASLIPPVIDFLAGLLHLGELPDEVAQVIIQLQARVYQVMDLVIGEIAERGRALLRSLGLGGDEDAGDDSEQDDELGTTVRFAAASHSHRLWVQTAGDDATLMVASTPQSVTQALDHWQADLAAGKPANPDAHAEATALLPQARAVADDADRTGDDLAAAFLQAAADTDDDVHPPSDNALENRERALSGMLSRLFELVEGKSPEEFVRDIAAHLPRRGAQYAGTVRDQWLPRIRRVHRAPAGAAGVQLWPDTVLSGTATDALGLLDRDSTHRTLLPWFLVGSASSPRQASGEPFFSQALRSDSPDPPHGVRTMFVTALGTATAQALRESALREITPADNDPLRTTVGQLEFSMAGGRWGSFNPWPADAVNPLVVDAVRAAGGIIPFLRSMIGGASGGLTWDQLMSLWNLSAETKNWLKREFRAVEPASHEWIPTGYIPEVIETAMSAASRAGVQNGLRWITAHTSLRSPTAIVLYTPRFERGPRGGVRSVEVSGHPGSFRDLDDASSMTGTVGTQRFHDWLRAEFDSNRDLGAVGFISHLRGRLPSSGLWDGSLPRDIPERLLDRRIGMFLTLVAGVDSHLTLRELAAAQQVNWAMIRQHFSTALAETSA